MTASESVSPSYSFYPFSTSTLNDILGKFSELSLRNIILGYMFMVSMFKILSCKLFFSRFVHFFLFLFLIFSVNLCCRNFDAMA